MRSQERELNMAEKVKLIPADRIEITTLIDNYCNLVLPSTEMIQRVKRADAEGKVAQSPLAGHGLSLLIEIFQGDEKYVTLMDAGFPVSAVKHNWNLLNFNPSLVDTIFLSHGHFDHYAALDEFLKKRERKIPMALHPEAFLERALIFPDGSKVELGRLSSRQSLEKSGAETIITEKPYLLSPCLVSTGEIERLTSFEGRFLQAYAKIDGKWQPDDFFDDQGLAAIVGEKGIVVITGCAHAGIVNTVVQARKITDVEKVYAIIGGFHLTGMPREQIDNTVRAIKAFDPDLVVPIHCTGFEAQCEIARQMPESFVLNSVGTRIVLSS